MITKTALVIRPPCIGMPKLSLAHGTLTLEKSSYCFGPDEAQLDDDLEYDLPRDGRPCDIAGYVVRNKSTGKYTVMVDVSQRDVTVPPFREWEEYGMEVIAPAFQAYLTDTTTDKDLEMLIYECVQEG